MIDRINMNEKCVQGLILEPTRELALQVADHLTRLGKYTTLKVCPIYGGASIQKQINALKRGVHIVVGTPGRIIDLLKRGALRLNSANIVVLDEADRMLDMGFRDDIDFILSKVSVDRQTSLFSATMDQNVMDVCHEYMKEPEKILVSKDEIALTQIDQFYVRVNYKNKFSRLCSILKANHIERAILFCKTRRGTERLADKLQRRGYNARPLHGGFTQNQRERVVYMFRKGHLKFLVATDIAARGLDIQGITHIINYDVPLDAMVYFHRIGRTARKGLEGTAITLVGYQEIPELNRIRSLTKTTIEEMPGSDDNYESKREVHQAICKDCGVKCEVPFKPNPSRPVYCRECWAERKPPIMRLV